MTFATTLEATVKKALDAYRDSRGASLSTDFVLGDAHALTLLLAARKEYGPDFVRWEPESIWLQHDFSHTNRDKLQAAKVLSTHPTLFTEPRGFAAIAHAIGDMVPDLHDLQPVPAEVMAWAAIEAELIFSLANPDESPEYSHDVVEFIAISLANDGFVCAPELLSFVDERLEEHLSDEGRSLRTKVCAAWDKLPKETLEEHEFPESPLGIQLARLAAVQVYCETELKELLAELP